MNAYKGRGKFWDIEDHKIGKGFKRINEDIWFKQQQPLLLWMANQKYGRDLLCIDRNFPKIIEFRKNVIVGNLGIEKIGEDSYIHNKIGDFRIGAKWANVIRHRWKEFKEYAQEYYRLQQPILRRLPILFPVVPQIGFAYTTTTFFPDPNPETTSVDGRIGVDDGTTRTFANERAAAGSIGDNAGAIQSAGRLEIDGASSPNFNSMYCGIFLFDTSAIPGSNTVSAGTESIENFNASADTYAEAQSLVLTNSAPASNTALATGDYTNHVANMGTERATNRIALAGVGASPVYRDFTLTAAALAAVGKGAGGMFKSGTRISAEFDNTSPTWAAGKDASFTANMADTAGTADDPKLVLTYSLPVTGGSHLMSLMGLGM